MIQNKQKQTDGDEISLIELLLFLKTSGGNIVKSTLACLLVGGAHYFFMPKFYKASATIEMAMAADVMVETPTTLIEKMKMPLYFSTSTLQICGSDGEFDSESKFFDKIKPYINKSAPFVSFVTQAQSSREAKACLNAVIAEVSSNQDAISKPLLEQKKQNLQKLSEGLKFAEEVIKPFLASKANKNNPTDEIFSVRNMSNIFRGIDSINCLRVQISTIENELVAPKTRSARLVGSVYAPELPVNKRPFYTLGLCLALGLILGLLVTGVMRVLPDVWRQMLEAKPREN
jgi:ElaB/YqjD/DUF883 family membrane-anchored ribosome-binding protein